jgi:N-acetylmuramoyl-L-alanine amidase
MRKINLIVVHVSDTPDGRDDRAEDIHRWHVERGWSGCGYHYVVCVDGIVEPGRPEYWVGSHVEGFNKDSIGVCLIGKYITNTIQLNALQTVLWDLRKRYPKARIVGHRDLDKKKTCPNFDVQAWCKEKGLA